MKRIALDGPCHGEWVTVGKYTGYEKEAYVLPVQSTAVMQDRFDDSYFRPMETARARYVLAHILGGLKVLLWEQSKALKQDDSAVIELLLSTTDRTRKAQIRLYSEIISNEKTPT